MYLKAIFEWILARFKRISDWTWLSIRQYCVKFENENTYQDYLDFSVIGGNFCTNG